ncbi:murein L,D-transpeptidase family protein [Catalinimonas alkaloidigena]|uniref:L,D-transpeptidase family protein n=1 Tax=Catalinimonas alkaloidigena TaxID=1075417 RepID=UPI00159F8BFA|nr:L,D-transpeptidase [Catalinimonas alkaloidigena]
MHATVPPTLSRLCDSLHLTPEQLRIVVTKSQYTLTVWHDSLALRGYDVVFGANPVDDKLRQGDHCTPEGTFRVKSKYPHAKWSYFIWLDYPTDDSWRKHRRAKLEGRIPPEAEIGGEIGIHGVPKGYDHAIRYKQNWTQGCVSMTTADLEDLYAVVTEGMLLEIKH